MQLCFLSDPTKSAKTYPNQLAVSSNQTSIQVRFSLI